LPEDNDMASIFPNGTQYAFSTAFASPIAVTAITNASTAVCSSATQPNDGSIVVVTSGWTALNNTVARTDNKDSDSFELENVNTSSTTRFPAGEGAGSVKAVSTWETLTQIQDVTFTGGDPELYTRQDLEDVNGRKIQIPTGESPTVMQVELEYDPNLDWYDALIAAHDAKTPIVVRAILPAPSSDTIYYFGYPHFRKQPTQGKNQGMKVTFSLYQLCDSARYAAA
jgi:hypothetical protein